MAHLRQVIVYDRGHEVILRFNAGFERRANVMQDIYLGSIREKVVLDGNSKLYEEGNTRTDDDIFG